MAPWEVRPATPSPTGDLEVTGESATEAGSVTRPRNEAPAEPSRHRDDLARRMGIEITDMDRRRLVGRMPVAGNQQPWGLLHGGASAVLAETLGTSAAALYAADDGRVALGVELSCTHHRAVAEGFVTGVATPLHVGWTVCTFEIKITDHRDELVCTARLSCALRRKARKSPLPDGPAEEHRR